MNTIEYGTKPRAISAEQIKAAYHRVAAEYLDAACELDKATRGRGQDRIVQAQLKFDTARMEFHAVKNLRGG